MRKKVLAIGIVISVVIALISVVIAFIGALLGEIDGISDLMLAAIIVSGVILVLVVDWYIADLFREIAKMKGHSSKEYFWVCFVFCVIGYFAVIALPDRADAKTSTVAADELPNL